MKKFLCLVLSIIIVLSCSLTVFAVDDGKIEQVDCDVPVIVVRGMLFVGGLEYDRGTENAKPVQPVFDFGKLICALGRTVGAAVINFSIDAGVSEVCKYVTELFSDYPCDNNGDSLHKNITAAYYPLAVENYPELLNNRGVDDEIGLVSHLADRYGADKVYYMVYDWRLDPMDNADMLDEMVNTALSDHNAEKVDIVCCSMGGSIAMAYMAEYGYDRIDTLVSNTSVMFGADVISDLFNGDVLFDADAVCRYVSAMVPDLAGFMKVADFTGILDGLCKFINSFAEKYERQIFDESLVPTFATLPGFWSMMHGEDYLSAREFIFGGKEDEYSGLLARLDNYYNSVSSRRQEITDGALEAGVKLCVLANYNTPLVPAYESAKYQGDGMIETGAMSGGAITSVVGSELSEEELGIGDSKYVSADKCINASTCLYPEYTWFAKDGGHVVGRYGSDYSFFLCELLESEVQPTINTWVQYPQFMLSDAQESLAPLV